MDNSDTNFIKKGKGGELTMEGGIFFLSFSRMANDNILCAIMRSHNTCDIMRYYVLLCAIMRQLCGVMRSLCAVPPTPPPKKSRSEVVKSAQNRAEFDFGVQMGLWCGFY